jgi:hypothetical protein
MYLRISLKVCEGCGVLWLRTEDCSEVYCSGCVRKLRSLPPRRSPGRYGPRPFRVPHRRDGSKTGGAA